MTKKKLIYIVTHCLHVCRACFNMLSFTVSNFVRKTTLFTILYTFLSFFLQNKANTINFSCYKANCIRTTKSTTK